MKQAPTPTIDAGGVQAIGSAAATAKIGPNAVTQLINALDAGRVAPAPPAVFSPPRGARRGGPTPPPPGGGTPRGLGGTTPP
ncbi:hypothetical protein P3G22_06355, partial [Rhodopseudomonas sp. BAL398]|nr:hypothetical protein [Rhodopseudomonas sp. BAL398]